MPVSIKALKVGDTVYDIRKVRQGNTTMRDWSTWPVHIEGIDLEAGVVLASWNGNSPTRVRARNGKLPWFRTNRRP